MKANIFASTKASPSTQLVFEKMTVTKITQQTHGGMAGGTETVYGNIVSEDDLFITFHDVIADRKVRLGKNYISKISDNVIVKIVTDVTQNRNYHKKTCEKAVITEYYDEPHDANLVSQAPPNNVSSSNQIKAFYAKTFIE